MFTMRMANNPINRSALVTALIAIAGFASAGQAQTTVTSGSGAAARADALHERAAGLFETPARYREAARLLREAASLREEIDDRGTAELLLAGRLSYYARDWSTAQRTFMTGGTRALENGQLYLAANAYVDAAFSALERRDQGDAFAFVGRAERLTSSDHLEHTEREKILGRIRPVRVALAVRPGR